MERNKHLVKIVKEEVGSNEKKIVVICGGAHLNKSGQFIEGASYLHDVMMESHIPFVILDQTKVSQVKDFDLSNEHKTAKKIALAFEGKVYPLKDMDDLTSELDGKYQIGKPYLTPHMERDVFRLAFPILSLTLMNKDGRLSEADLHKKL